MTRREKLLIAVIEIVFLLLAFLIGVVGGERHVLGPLAPQTKKHADVKLQEELNKDYNSYNALYFNRHLPKDIVIDYGEYDDNYLAGRFLFGPNPTLSAIRFFQSQVRELLR